jgi:hypothetical protein
MAENVLAQDYYIPGIGPLYSSLKNNADPKWAPPHGISFDFEYLSEFKSVF